MLYISVANEDDNSIQNPESDPVRPTIVPVRPGGETPPTAGSAQSSFPELRDGVDGVIVYNPASDFGLSFDAISQSIMFLYLYKDVQMSQGRGENCPGTEREDGTVAETGVKISTRLLRQ